VSASRQVLTVAVLAAIFAALPAVARADWPVYGHDLSNSRNAGGEGPSPSQVGSLKQAWAFNSSTGDFTATPVVAGGVLVAGNNGGWIYALSAVTGKVLWSRSVGQQINGTAAIDLHAPGGPLAFVPVAEIGSPRLLALSLKDGTVRWDKVLTNQAGSDVFGSPTFWNGTVYIGTSGPNNDNSTARGSVVALSEASGHVRWQTFTVPAGHDGGAVWSTPAIDPSTGRLYVGTGNAYHQPAADTTDAMMVLSASSGTILAHFQATPSDAFAADNPAGPDADFGASPNLILGPTGESLVGEGQKSGTYWALDRTTMQPAWDTTIGPGSAVGGILASTAYDGARIYGTDSADGQLWALGHDGAIQWSSLDPSTLDFSPVAIANGVLYSVDPTGFLIARDPTTGAVMNALNLGGLSFGGVSAVGAAIFAAVGTGPPPQPAPPQDGPGAIIAFGDTSHSAAH
jgi:polyvinyl alcohol dehydrogenase (cytochrome)